MSKITFLLLLFLVALGFEQRLHTCKAGTLPLEPHLQSIFALVILEMGSHKVFAQTGLEIPSSQP
jgi:hypothetical protein